MRYGITLFLLAIFLSFEGQAQSKKKAPKPDLENWTDEQLDLWEDSVKKALYPDPEIKQSPVPVEANVSEETETGATGIASQAMAPLASTLSVSIDQSKGVGEIPIIPGTSPTGGATYQVPVDVYPGPKGIQPQLALVYNSSAGNSLLGVGWGLSGISKITRINKSIYYDGQPGGISRTKDDALALDGMRLIKTSETTGYIRYESEQGNIRAIAYLNGSVTKYFEVLYPNGNKGIFGYTTNTATQYLEYPLTSLTDLQGNTINYTYLFSDNHYLVTKITYGDNGGAAVEFEYDTSRTDPFENYQGGLRVYENRRLAKIHCKYGSNTLHTYSVSYSTAKDYSVISQIDYSAGGNSFNPLLFSYGTGNNQTAYTTSNVQLLEWFVAGSSPGLIRVTKGKFDYGSDDDGLISLPEKNPYWNHYRNSTWLRHSQNRYDNLYAGDEKIFLYAGLSETFASPVPSLTTEAGFIDIFCANVDGKYEEEVVKVNNKINESYDQLTFKVYSANLYAGLALKYTRTYNFSTVLTDADGGKSIHPKFYFSGDFNGNGKMEVLAVSCHNPIGNTSITSKCYLFDLESNSKLYEGYVFPYVVDFVGVRQTDPDAAFDNTDRLFVMDYDGDGKSDICLINDSGTNIYTFDVSGSTYTLRKVATYTSLKKTNLPGRNLMPGEFDGDGLIDLLVSPLSNGNSWSIYHSMGNGQFYLTTFTGTTRSTADNNGELLQDVNGDGLTDLIKYSSSGFYTYLTKNGTPSTSECYSSKTSYSKLIPTSINSRNIFSQLLCLKDGTVSKYVFSRDDTRERMLSAAYSSLGVEYRNGYQKLNSSGDNSSGPVYTKGYGAVFPYENLNGPLWALSTREVWLDGQKKESTSYNYDNAVIHKQGLGFRGFGRINSYDNIRGRSFVQEIDPYNYSLPKTDESPTAKNTYQFSVTVQANKVLKTRLTQKTTYDKLKKTNATSSFTYDIYGNPTRETVSLDGDITVTTDNKFINSTSDAAYFLGFVYDQTVTTSRSGLNSSKRFWFPSSNKMLPDARIGYVDGKQTYAANYTYDSFGKLKSKQETRFSSATLTTTYSYDAFGHLISETDPMAFTTEIHYGANGLPDYIKNHKGQQTSLRYDEFGRMKTQTNPLGLVTTIIYRWNTVNTNGLYYITQFTTGQTSQRTWYDAFGRELEQAVQRFDGLWSQIDKLYDSYGRLQKVSLPFAYSDGRVIEGSPPPVNGSASHWNTYTYDSYDRLLTVTQASGKKTSYSYDGLKTTTTSEGIATTRTYDALGKLVKAEDPGGAITYTLRPDGQPSTIEAPGGIITAINYDEYGRQITLVDPSAGTTSYGYDSAGNLNKQTDAEGRVTNMVFDDYGRITSKSYPELSTSYNYNTDGLLETVTSNNGTSTVYTYDIYDRLKTEKETGADGLWIEKAYTYKADGNPETQTFKTQDGAITSEHYTYNYGELTEIKLNGATSIFKLTAQNALGQPTAVTTGPLARQYSYDNYGIPTGRTAGNLMDAAYSFEAATGNLLSRKDNKRNKTESFDYDGLNRLINFGTYTASYDDKGNLAGKTDVGSFYYTNSSKPYALSGADLATDAVPLRNQNVTYSSFEQPLNIAENGYLAAFTYNAEGQRVKMELKQNGVIQLVRHYLGACYEKDLGLGGTKEKLYLGGDAYSAPAVYVKQGSGSWQLYYLCRDYLGSITHLADSNGSLTQELSFDAWGRLRDPATQTAYAPGAEPALFLGRGYTGHEHLPWFGLVNMNGRLYDPAVGRFLSPDNYVQLPDFSQNLNRYSYCLNNPLKYADPDGELFWIFPHISWSKKGGLSIGFSAVLGIPGLASVQAGGGINLKSGEPYAFAGTSYAFNAAYISWSPSSGLSAGYATGASIYSGLPISTNFLTVGANYNISHNSWSGNLSAWDINRNGFSFNPSVSAIILPEQTTNFVRGKGFRTNDKVLSNFVASENYQGALDYFGLKGEYVGGEGQSYFWFNKNDHSKYGIRYTEGAFDSYDALMNTYLKESFHMRRFARNGLNGLKLANSEVFSLANMPEERLGVIHQYKNQGLSGYNMDYMGAIGYTENRMNIFNLFKDYNPPYTFSSYSNKWWHFIYKIPRRW
ncbi:RHS repeat-associated core domain-containing protein [Gaoshiqia sp. Z1-71]|uniref:RHS repeat-associated core domain-containing protein n=1 Tax=Gaoshiqia hydrogeniformans TaxID=3290090 RepID=UPI003BF8571A